LKKKRLLACICPSRRNKGKRNGREKWKNGREREVLSFFLAFTERRKRKNIISVPPPVPEYLFFFY